MNDTVLNQPLVTIVLPTYNVEDYLNECIDSVIGQTYRNLEIICVNDGSTDKSGMILREYAENDDRIKVIEQENAGLSAARNVGLDVATGKYIIFWDTDDYFDLNTIELMVNKSEEHDADMCICEVQRFDDNTKRKMAGKYIKTPFPKKEPFSWEDWKEYIFVNSVVVHNKLMRLDFLKQNNIRFSKVRIYEDFEYGIMNLRLASKIVIVNEKLIQYRKNRKGSLTYNPCDRMRELVQAHENTWDKLTELGLLEDEELQKGFINKVALDYRAFCRDFNTIDQFRECFELIFHEGSILNKYDPEKYQIPVADYFMVKDPETFLIDEYHRYYKLYEKAKQNEIDKNNEIKALKRKIRKAETINKSLIKFISYNFKRIIRFMFKKTKEK